MSRSPAEDAVDRIARVAREAQLRVACAESLTSGRIMARLGAGAGASRWFAGGVVAYDEEVKFQLLGVTRGPVITAQCARELASGVCSLLGADVGLGITGCGGPDPEEGRPPGTTYLAVCTPRGVRVEEACFGGSPDEVLDAASDRALALLDEAVAELVAVDRSAGG